ncbi:MAG: AsmA family protein [Deltaproteobacteria bacterium]|nr:AsmA family protein [Deltaproteobacteria bacterium]
MKRVLVLFSAVLLSLLLLAVTAAGLILALVDPNDYKEDISAVVYASTGRRLILQGDLALTLLPLPEIKTGAFQIRDHPDFGAEPFLAARSASLRLSLRPLLGGRLEAQEILLDGLRLKLAVSATGRKNWAEDGNGPESSADVKELKETPARETSLNLAARSLRLSDAEAVYRNLAEGSSLRLTLDSLELEHAALGADMPFNMLGKLEDAHSALQTSFALRGEARLEADGTASARLESLKLKAAEAGAEADLAGKLSFAPENLRAELSGKVGETSLKARADLTLPGSLNPGLGIRGELALGSLDLDALSAAVSRLTPKAPVREGGAQAPSSAPPAAAVKLPPLLRSLDADLDFSANTLLAAGLPLTMVSVQVKAQAGQARIPYSLKLFQGTISGAATADLRPETPLWGLEGQIRDLAAGDLLAALHGKRTLSGLLSGQLSIQGKGLSRAAALASLSGKGEAGIINGEARGLSLIPPGLPGLEPLPLDFPLEKLFLSVALNRGLAEIKEAVLLSPLLTARGSGTANLARGTLDLALRFRLAGDALEIPLLVGGTFEQPGYALDLARMGQNTARTILDSPEETGKILRGLKGLAPRK